MAATCTKISNRITWSVVAFGFFWLIKCSTLLFRDSRTSCCRCCCWSRVSPYASADRLRMRQTCLRWIPATIQAICRQRPYWRCSSANGIRPPWSYACAVPRSPNRRSFTPCAVTTTTTSRCGATSTSTITTKRAIEGAMRFGLNGPGLVIRFMALPIYHLAYLLAQIHLKFLHPAIKAGPLAVIFKAILKFIHLPKTNCNN